MTFEEKNIQSATSQPKVPDPGEEMWERIEERERKQERVSLISKTIAAFVLIVITSLFLKVCHWVFIGNTVDLYSEEIYTQMAKEDAAMPVKSELGNFENVIFKCRHFDGHLIVFYEAFTALATYSDTEYEKQKNEVMETYTFVTGKVVNGYCDDPDNRELEPVFTHGGFEFKLQSETEFPKSVYLIGFNDETKQIAFVRYKDTDIDYINSYDEFLNDCGWEW